MARRREPPEVETDLSPAWVRQTLAGLARFNGDMGAWRAAQAEWCRRNGCYRAGKPCAEVFGGKECAARRESG